MSGNDEVQANHQILKIFESSKGYNDQILDALPGIYVVFSKAGEIYRSNAAFATLVKREFEAIHLYNLPDMLPDTEWNLLRGKMGEVDSPHNAPQRGLSFEMDITVAGTKASFLFFLSLPSGQGHKQQNFYTLLGQEVTEVKAIARENSRMQSELKTAQEVQKSLFASPTAVFEGGSIAGSYVSATECGGDWWFYNIIGGKIFLWIGDVTGHGVSAALVVAAVRSAAVFLENESDLKPSRALQLLNEVVLGVSKGEKYMTFFVASIDIKTGECCYAHAGHHMPYVITKKANTARADVFSLLAPNSEILGSAADPTFEDHHIQLNPGDFLVAFTDGVLENRNNKNIQYGDRRFLESLKKLESDGCATCDDVLKNVTQKLRKFCGTVPLDDDQTLIVFQRLAIK